VLAKDAIIVAGTADRKYLYVRVTNRGWTLFLMTALQERAPYGPVFVRRCVRSGPGTLPLTRIGLRAIHRVAAAPRMVVNFDFDENVARAERRSRGVRALEPCRLPRRSQRPSFSRRNVHNTLIGLRTRLSPRLTLPFPRAIWTSHRTIAALLGLALPHAEGRVLRQAFVNSHV